MIMPAAQSVKLRILHHNPGIKAPTCLELKVSDKEIQKYQQAKEYRAQYRNLLSEIKKQIKFLRGTQRGKVPDTGYL